MPDRAVPDGLNPHGDADHSACWHRDDDAGYRAAITNPGNHTTFVSHNYRKEADPNARRWASCRLSPRSAEPRTPAQVEEQSQTQKDLPHQVMP